MKVIHICTSLTGGAGLCAKRIIDATRVTGVDARALVSYGQRSDIVDIIADDIQSTKNPIKRKVKGFANRHGIWPKMARENAIIHKELRNIGGTICFTSPRTIYKGLVNHPWIKEADIIHLHWVGDFLDYKSFFENIKKPIIWTIHDENPGLGGFHYSMWKEFGTPALNKLDEDFKEVKKHAYEQVESFSLVAISTMMREYFQRNEILCQIPCTIIHNGIEAESFTPIPPKVARQALGINENSVVFIFAAHAIKEDRKGLKELIMALELKKIPNTVLLCLGNYYKKPIASFEVRCEGFVSNSRLLSIYYSAANFFMMPSFQEAFAQTPMEAMACGTPVIAFPCSGSRDLIDDDNGVVCNDFTIDELVRCIGEAQSRKYDRDVIRNKLISRFSYDKIAVEYIKLYEKILSKNETLNHNNQL